MYLAEARGGVRLAVKVVRPEHAGDRTFRARFRQELRAARDVGGDGTYTARVVDADPEGEPPWMATEFVEGPTLRDAVLDACLLYTLRMCIRDSPGPDRDPRQGPGPPGPQALQHPAGRGRTAGHRLRHRPGAGGDRADESRIDRRHGRLCLPGTDPQQHRSGPAERCVRAGRRPRPRLRRPPALRRGARVGGAAAHPERRPRSVGGARGVPPAGGVLSSSGPGRAAAAGGRHGGRGTHRGVTARRGAAGLVHRGRRAVGAGGGR